MRRQMSVLGGLVVAAVIMALAAAVPAKMEQYQSEVILSLPWGSGPNEIGYAKEGPEDQEGLRYGPTAIDVDRDGSIYILDTVNARVKVFSQKGTLLKNFSVRPGRSLCVDAHKAVWIVDYVEHTIYKYIPDGSLVEIIQYEGTAGMKIKVRKDDKIYLDESIEVQEQETIGRGKKGENIRRSILKRMGPCQGITRSGRHYRVEKTNDWIRTFVATDESGRVLSSISIEKHSPYDGISFKSEDRYGNTYLVVYRDSGMPEISYRIEIWKYNPSDNLIAKIGPIFRTFYTEVQGEWLVVNEEGDVYQLVTQKEGVKIVKWSKTMK